MGDLKNQIFEFEGFRLDAGKRLLVREDGETVPLMPKAFDTLLYLVRNSGRLIEKDELMRAIWTDTIVEENNLNQNISTLRRCFGEKRGEHRFIATIPGRGYEFVADVRTVAGSEAILSADVDTEGQHDGGSLVSAPIGRNSWPILAAAGLVIVVLGGLGFYLWRQGLSSAVPDGPVKTIAVLPFKPLVLENRDEALEMGMADTLISKLGSYREVIVLPLSSVRKYGGPEQNAVEAGKSLGSDSVLDGSIQRWGNKIRVNVRLLRTSDGSTLWSDTFDEEFTDIFVVQDAISGKVVSALALRLSPDEQERLERRPTSSARAYELYLRGRYHYYKITLPDILKAIELYKQAIEVDPNYAQAYAAIADAYRTQAIAAQAPSRQACAQAKVFASRALEIDKALADSYIVLGWIAFLCDWDWRTAESNLKRAIELAPNDAETHRAYAHMLSNLGRHDEAIRVSAQAVKLAPLNLIIATLDGYFLLYAGRHDEAIDRLRATIELDPKFWAAHNGLGRVYVVQGRYEEAISAFTKARELSSGSPEPVAHMGYALAKSSRPEEALATLRELKHLSEKNHVPMYFFAVVNNGLGNENDALSYLERSYQEGEVQLGFIKVDTRWNNLRTNPRFVQLSRNIGLD